MERPNLVLTNTCHQEPYSAPQGGRGKPSIDRDPSSHAAKLCKELEGAFAANDDRRALAVADRHGIYLEFIGPQNGNKAIGQFFTPYNVARMMAEVNTDVEKVKSHIDEHGYLSVNEPAAGGGANLIALANHLKREGVNYQRSVLFVAQELSELTALSCYVQMSLLGMPGIVLIGDTLRMDFRFELWTPMLALDETWLYRMMFRRLIT